MDPLDRGHLTRLRRLADDARAVALSEHLCWSSSGGVHVHDLLPLPFDPATLVFVGARIDAAQQVLGRQLLIENIARYTTPPSTMPESTFLSSLAARTGCGLLVDLNNLHVNEVNHGAPAAAFLDDIDWSAVGEIHLAGGEPDGDWLIDTHGADVPTRVG